MTIIKNASTVESHVKFKDLGKILDGICAKAAICAKAGFCAIAQIPAFVQITDFSIGKTVHLRRFQPFAPIPAGGCNLHIWLELAQMAGIDPNL